MVGEALIVPTSGARLELRACAGDAILTAYDLALGTGVLVVLAPGQASVVAYHLDRIARGITC